jgi:hypothetical protein
MLTMNYLRAGFEAWWIGVWSHFETFYAFEGRWSGIAIDSIDTLTELKGIKPWSEDLRVEFCM